MDQRINTTQDIVELTDTIAAISTASGEGGIGIIRLSGPAALAIAQEIFRRNHGERLENPEPYRLYYGYVHHPNSGEVIDEVLLSYMKSPHSYTCEDVVEISGHGGAVPLHAILTILCQQGARLARPGEFTERAFLNGRIDLTQAEAVLDTIRARTDAGLRAAQHCLRGDIAKQISTLRQRLVALLSSLEAAIDYADEDITFLSTDQIHAELEALCAEINMLIASHSQGKLLREGAQTVIIGRPNTGKSSLLNILLGEERAIVTDIPGTTRDVIEEYIDFGGVPLRLIDTAGIRRTDDKVERIGVQRSRQALAQADLILLVIDRSTPLASDDVELLLETQNQSAIVVLNKADLVSALTPDAICEYTLAPTVEISTLTREGITQLEDTMRELLFGNTIAESTVLANTRQKDAAERAYSSLNQAVETLNSGGSEELIAVDVMAAATSLGEITGDNIREEVIQDLFSRFCVGK
ncbi:MAG TPA: tRNA uridine-5-carboxymethylaminomethyl(34) synthesis GTPase MnmE [Armatimonadota bacterium]|nr:tRNA uridine-5-carboxymethylaminomethyl(34) synthesis GTPase MnmE [Armatimonadota bacterium]